MRANQRVRAAVKGAKGISFDGCHKIYVLLDDESVAQSREWGYGEDGSYLLTGLTSTQMFAQIKDWWDESCSLKFVQSVGSVPPEANPNDGYKQLVSQAQGWYSEVREWDR